jgi:hypothetical protein
MRIRKRQAVVVVPSRTTVSVLNVIGNEEERSAGQNTCTCCSRQRRLQNWELRNRFGPNSDEPSNGFAGGITVVTTSQVGHRSGQSIDGLL